MTIDQRAWITRTVGEPVFERLAGELSGSELQSVLLEVTRRRARGRVPRDVVAQHERDGFCRPAAVDQRTAAKIDAHLLAAAEGFDAIELSPLAPLATCSAVALTDQNRIVSSIRGTEVVSDPTNVLALECALRLRKRPNQILHFATSQRVVRAQPPKRPGQTPHFRIFVLASGGNETKDHAFTVATLVRHVHTVQAALDRLEGEGYSFGRRRLDVLASAERAPLGDRIAEALGGSTTRKPLDHAYYSGGLRIVQWVTAPDGTEVPLVDGGSFDWLAKLTSNRRAVYIATGMGAQLVALRFAAPAAEPGRAT